MTLRLISYREAVKLALYHALKHDPRVFLMGEDVGRYGGYYAVSKGLLAEFGPERIRNTPLSENMFVGAGIGAALGGMRPIVEIKTINFILLPLDQIINNAATLCHMSGGQFNVPLVIRMASGAGTQMAAQHSHSFEGLLAHIPGLKVLAPATVADALGMLWSALQDPNPVLICEHIMLYDMQETVDCTLTQTDIAKAIVRKTGMDITIIAYSVMVQKALQAAEELAKENIHAEVVDLRTLRPLDEETIVNSVKKTHHAVIVDEGWKSVSLASEIMARLTEKAFDELNAPPARVCTVEAPIPYPKHLETAAIPQVSSIIAAVKRVLNK